MEKISDSTFYWDLVISLEERMTEIDSIPISDQTNELHEEYALVVYLLGCLYNYLLEGQFDAFG